MEILKELSSVLTKNKTKSIRVIDHFNIPKTKLEFFFDGLRSGGISTDEEALNLLYPKNKHNPSSKNKYYKLKFDLRDKLLNTLIFIDSSFVHDGKREHKSLYVRKLAILYDVSIHVKIPKTSDWLLRKIIKTALEYDFWDIVTNYSFIYSQLLVNRTNNKIYDNQYFKIFEDYQERLYLLNKIQILYIEIERKISQENKFESLLTFINDELSKTKILPKKKMSYVYLRTLTFIKLIKHSAVYNYPKCLQISNEYIAMCNNIKYLDGYVDNRIYFQKIEACILLNFHESGIDTADLLIKQTNPTSHGHMISTLTKVLLFLKNNYILEAIKEEKQYQSIIHEAKLLKTNTEYWQIINGWFHFLEEIKTADKTNPRINFNIFKLVNNLPVTTKSKQGNYINLLFLEICFLIIKQDFNTLIDKIESIKRFKRRYFTSDKNIRINTFIDMLFTLYKCNFEVKLTKEKTKEHFLLLQEMSLADSKQDIFKEVVPLEMVWEKIIDYLD